MRTGWMLGLVLLVSACGGGGATDRPLTDQKGRSCVNRCEGSSCTLTCQATPTPFGGCSGTFGTACFDLASYQVVGASAKKFGLCDGCCNGSGAKLFEQGDCTPVVCRKDSDCADDHATCGDAGLCLGGP